MQVCVVAFYWHCMWSVPVTIVKLTCIYNTVVIESSNLSCDCSRKQCDQSDNKRSTMIKNILVRANLAKICKCLYNYVQIKSKLESKTLELPLKFCDSNE